MAAADALPVYHHRERHSLHVAATPAEALAAARGTQLDDLALVSVLVRLRGLRGRGDSSLWSALQARGFALHDPETLVLIGKPWTPTGARRRGEDFSRFAEPGYAKLALDLRAERDDGGARLTTETRVFLTDAKARRRFAAYWLLIRPFSGLIRSRWLRAAKLRAERRSRI